MILRFRYWHSQLCENSIASDPDMQAEVAMSRLREEKRKMRNIPVELRKHYEEEGWWTQETLGELLARGLAAHPDTGFWVHSEVRPFSGTFRDVELMARRLAAGLRARGVGPGDVIAFQLPNWVEAAVTFWASAFLGAVVVPIVHFYGRKELAYIIDTAKPKVFISTAHFRHMEFHADLCADVPIVGLVGTRFRRPAGRRADGRRTAHRSRLGRR